MCSLFGIKIIVINISTTESELLYANVFNYLECVVLNSTTFRPYSVYGTRADIRVNNLVSNYHFVDNTAPFRTSYINYTRANRDTRPDSSENVRFAQ